MNESYHTWALLQFLLGTQQHIHENIKFADQKAAQVITLNTAAIAAVYAVVALSQSRHVLVAFGAWIFLSIGIGYAVSAIRPRGEQNEQRGPGLLDAVRIVQQGPEAYYAALSSASVERLTKEMQEFIYDRACIDRDKYTELRRSLFYSAAGWSVSLLTAAASLVPHS